MKVHINSHIIVVEAVEAVYNFKTTTERQSVTIMMSSGNYIYITESHSSKPSLNKEQYEYAKTLKGKAKESYVYNIWDEIIRSRNERFKRQVETLISKL